MFLKQSRSITVFLLMIALGLTASQVDMYIASLPYMVDYFKSTQEMLQFTISASILGTSIVTLFIGQLSDAFGRRHLIVWSQFLYALFSFAAAFSPTIETLIFWRFMSGVVSCTTFVLALAVVADMYPPKQASIHYANMTTTILVALIIAPLIGGYFAEIKRWDYSFLLLGFGAFISALSLWLYLPETLKEKRHFSFKQILQSYREMFSNSRFIGLSIMPGILIGGLIAFFANGSFFYIRELGLSEWDYSVHQIFIMASNCMFSFLAGRAIKRFGLDITCKLGLYLVVSGGALFCISAYFLTDDPVFMTISMSVFASGVGFSFAAVTAISMAIFPTSPGTTSAILTLVRCWVISAAIAAAGLLYVDKAIEIAYAIGGVCLISSMIYFGLVRQKDSAVVQSV